MMGPGVVGGGKRYVSTLHGDSDVTTPDDLVPTLQHPVSVE